MEGLQFFFEGGGYFVVFGGKLITRILDAELQGPIHLDRSVNCLIIRSDNIFNVYIVEVNGVFAINMIVHNSLSQNQNRLKF